MERWVGELGGQVEVGDPVTCVCDFSVSLWKGKSEDVDSCLAGKLRTLEACTSTFSILLVLEGAGTRPSPVPLKAGIFLSGQPVLQEQRDH